jgi:hypothetical protein
MTRRSQHYPPELVRERRMAAEVTPNHDSQRAAVNVVAQKLGMGTAETVGASGRHRPAARYHFRRIGRGSSGCAGRMPSCAARTEF